MSLPPLCVVCGTKHHGHQAHVFPRTLSRVTPAVEAKREEVKPEVVETAHRAKAGEGLSNAVSNAVTKRITKDLTKDAIATKRKAKTAQTMKWRAAHPEEYRTYQRELMRRRAARRVSGS